MYMAPMKAPDTSGSSIIRQPKISWVDGRGSS
jgi:hypothetical protein